MKKENAGYQITDFISVEGQNVVLGHHPSPKCPSPYVTWVADAEMDNFYFGHYFGEKPAAIADMIQRATYALERPDGIPLAVDFLSDYARESLEMQFLEAKAIETIKDALEEVLVDEEQYPTKFSAEDLLKNPDFVLRAKRSYENIDHSDENYFLRTSIENILDEHPEFLASKELHAEVRIPPEQSELIQDILSMPTAAVVEKYGQLANDIQFEFPLENGKTAKLCLLPEEDAYNNHALSETDPHFVYLYVLNKDGFLEFSQSYTVEDLKDMNNGTMTGKYEVQLDDHTNLTLELTVDESLRRTGNQFVFHSSESEQASINEHDGEICMVQRQLTCKECDVLTTGLMWEAQFPNGEVIHVFDDELEPVEPSRKPDLGKIISDAQDKVSKEPHLPEGKVQER